METVGEGSWVCDLAAGPLRAYFGDMVGGLHVTGEGLRDMGCG
jgi:hypothetical protein